MMVESWLAASQPQASFWLSSPPYCSLMHLDENKQKPPVNGLTVDLSGPMLGGLMSQNHQLQPDELPLTSMCGSTRSPANQSSSPKNFQYICVAFSSQ
jgi:hypothetical protein